jgi:hypothetical protein
MRIGGWITFPLAVITLGVTVSCGSVDARSDRAPGQEPSTSISSTDTLGSTDTDAAPTATTDEPEMDTAEGIQLCSSRRGDERLRPAAH